MAVIYAPQRQDQTAATMANMMQIMQRQQEIDRQKNLDKLEVALLSGDEEQRLAAMNKVSGYGMASKLLHDTALGKSFLGEVLGIDKYYTSTNINDPYATGGQKPTQSPATDITTGTTNPSDIPELLGRQSNEQRQAVSNQLASDTVIQDPGLQKKWQKEYDPRKTGMSYTEYAQQRALTEAQKKTGENVKEYSDQGAYEKAKQAERNLQSNVSVSEPTEDINKMSRSKAFDYLRNKFQTEMRANAGNPELQRNAFDKYRDSVKSVDEAWKTNRAQMLREREMVPKPTGGGKAPDTRPHIVEYRVNDQTYKFSTDIMKGTSDKNMAVLNLVKKQVASKGGDPNKIDPYGYTVTEEAATSGTKEKTYIEKKMEASDYAKLFIEAKKKDDQDEMKNIMEEARKNGFKIKVTEAGLKFWKDDEYEFVPNPTSSKLTDFGKSGKEPPAKKQKEVPRPWETGWYQ